jgi:hypothetical protein
MAWTKFGEGTLTYTIDAGTPVSFAQEVKGGGIEHEYTEVGEDTTYLDGTEDPAGEIRADHYVADCDFDLGAAGFYNFMYTNDLQSATVEFTPNDTASASWTGTVRLKLPDGAKGEKFGSKLSGSVKHSFIAPATFTPASP